MNYLLVEDHAASLYEVYEFGLGDNSYGAAFVANTLDVAAEIQESDLANCVAAELDLPEPVACEAPGKEYLGTRKRCTAMLFSCSDGAEPFFDDCGCGCTKPAAPEPPPDTLMLEHCTEDEGFDE